MAEKSYEDEAETLFATFPELRDVAAPMTLMENMNAAHIQFLNLTDQSPPQRNDVPHTPPIRRNQVPLVSATVQQHSPPQQTPPVATSQAEHSSPEIANTPASQVELQPPQNGAPSPSASVTGKRIRWSELEHKLFLLGLEKCGKGDWQNISRYYVKTKTSAQVASHAQKYFLRHNGSSKEKKRKSIHDITLQNKRPVSHHHQNVPSPKIAIPQQSHPMHRSAPSTNLAMQQLHNVHHLVPHHNINNQQNRVPSPNLTIQRSPNMHHSVPHHIDQQRWAPSTNLAVQQLHDVHHLVPHHNNQQNRVPSPNLTIQRSPNMLHHSVPHHIDQQRWVPSTNLAVQPLHDVHHLVPHHNNQQNRVPSPNLRIPNMHHSVPHHIDQKSWAPSTNFAKQQIHNVHHSLPPQIYHQNRTPTNLAMQQPHRMHLTQEMIHMNPPVNMPHQMGGFNNGFPPNNVSSYGRI